MKTITLGDNPEHIIPGMTIIELDTSTDMPTFHFFGTTKPEKPPKNSVIIGHVDDVGELHLEVVTRNTNGQVQITNRGQITVEISVEGFKPTVLPHGHSFVGQQEAMIITIKFKSHYTNFQHTAIISTGEYDSNRWVAILKIN